MLARSPLMNASLKANLLLLDFHLDQDRRQLQRKLFDLAHNDDASARLPTCLRMAPRPSTPSPTLVCPTILSSSTSCSQSPLSPPSPSPVVPADCSTPAICTSGSSSSIASSATSALNDSSQDGWLSKKCRRTRDVQAPGKTRHRTGDQEALPSKQHKAIENQVPLQERRRTDDREALLKQQSPTERYNNGAFNIQRSNSSEKEGARLLYQKYQQDDGALTPMSQREERLNLGASRKRERTEDEQAFGKRRRLAGRMSLQDDKENLKQRRRSRAAKRSRRAGRCMEELYWDTVAKGHREEREIDRKQRQRLKDHYPDRPGIR